jgi:hypothetical protein
MNKHGALPTDEMKDPESMTLPVLMTDDEIVEERAQAQFKAIIAQKREHDLQERITARIHELAQAADLKPQTDETILQHLTLQKVDQMRHAHLEQTAKKAADKAFATWLLASKKPAKH